MKAKSDWLHLDWTYEYVQADFKIFLKNKRIGSWTRWKWRELLVGRENYKRLMWTTVHSCLTKNAKTAGEHPALHLDKLLIAYDRFLTFKKYL